MPAHYLNDCVCTARARGRYGFDPSIMTPGMTTQRRRLSGGLLGLLLLAAPAFAEDLDREFTFAEKLVEWGFPDFANKLMDAVVRKNPDQAGRAKIVKAEGLIAQRKFADAEAVVNEFASTDPKGDAVRLALANGYYRYGDTAKAKQLYNEFFNKYKTPPSDADLLRFFRESAFRYAQMLKDAGDKAGAVDALGRLLATGLEKAIARPVMAEQAQLYVDLARAAQGGDRDKHLAAATKLCKDIQWQGVDEWFGHSIITMANIELVRGNREGARKLINKDYADILKEVDKQMREANVSLAQSPMAGARFLLGEMYQAEVEPILGDASKRDQAIDLLAKALNEYYNVFVQYGDSDWGPESGVRANAIKGQLEGFGKTVKIDLGAQADKAAATQFRVADNLYRQKQFPEAVREYLKALNAYPETSVSVRSLGYLMSCYVEQNDPLMVKAVAAYIADRFAGRDEGAVALLATASSYLNRKDDAMSFAMYETYLRGFPKHDKAGTVLFHLGSQRKKAGDHDGANHFFQRIVDHYPKDQYYPKALVQMAWGYYQGEQYDKALAGFQKLVNDIPPSPDRASAQFSLADCMIRLGQWIEAAAELEKLIGWLAPKDNPYATTPEDAAKNKALLEKAVFQRANCYAIAKEPADQVKSYREKGMKAYEQFIQLFPESALAPKALMGMGRIQLDLGLKDAGVKTFDELALKYPASEEGKNALYSLARTSMELGQHQDAKAAFEKMMAKSATYKPDEFTRIGQLMIDAKLYDEAIRAFRQVLDNPKIAETKDLPESRALLERALFGVGNANFEKKQYQEAVQALDQLLADYPKSGLFFDAKFMLGEAYGELGQVGKASEVMGDIFRFASDQDQINKASMKLAQIQLKGGDKAGAFASYQRISLLADPNKPAQRAVIEQALWHGLPVAMDLGRYKDAIEACDQYLQLFPTSEKLNEIRRIRAEANLKAPGSAAAAK